jgi:hypothetical protein
MNKLLPGVLDVALYLTGADPQGEIIEDARKPVSYD